MSTLETPPVFDTGLPASLTKLVAEAWKLPTESESAVVFELAMWMRRGNQVSGGQLATVRVGLRHFRDPQLKLRLAYTYLKTLPALFFRDLDVFDLEREEQTQIIRAALGLDPPDNDEIESLAGSSFRVPLAGELNFFDSLGIPSSEKTKILKDLLLKSPYQRYFLAALFASREPQSRRELLKIYLENIHRVNGIWESDLNPEEILSDFGLKDSPANLNLFPAEVLGYLELRRELRHADQSSRLKAPELRRRILALGLSDEQRFGFMRDILYHFPGRLPALAPLMTDLSLEHRTDLAKNYFEHYFQQLTFDEWGRFDNYSEIVAFFGLPKDSKLLEEESRVARYFAQPEGTPVYVRRFRSDGFGWSRRLEDLRFDIARKPIHFLNRDFDGFLNSDEFSVAERRSFAETLLTRTSYPLSELRTKFRNLDSVLRYFNLSPAQAAGLQWPGDDE